MTTLAGKVAIVTGAAAGIGLASAKLLALEGATVILADVDEAAAARAASDLESAGLSATSIRVDVSQEDDVCAMVDLAQQRFGGLDILFNNAGVAGEDSTMPGIPLETWDRIIAINLTGTFLAMKYAIPAMLERRGGSIINNASVLGLVGFAKSAAYSASKGGVIQLTRAASIEFATKGIRVNCICPGFVETSMVEGKDSAGVTRAAFLKVLEPMGRLGKPEEIADMVLFLASERSSFMTGAIIPVDGGFVAR